MFLRLAKHQRIIASFLLINFLTLLVPIQSKALSSGPSQPETQQFAPAGMDDMVDPFTGDFSYNIPLMDVGGYPINLNYASGITPDAEASWVGLGWNLNVGAITRSVRGLPDDFAGDDLRTDYNIKPNQTYGSKINVSFKAFGFKPDKFFSDIKLGLNANVFYNNYNGMGISFGVSPTLSTSSTQKGSYTGNLGLSMNVGSESGVDISPTFGISKKEMVEGKEQTVSGASISFPFNTREGLKGMTLSANQAKNNRLPHNVSGTFGFSTPTYTPSIQQSHSNFAMSLGLGLGPATGATEFPAIGFEGYYSGQFLVRNESHNQAFGYMYSGIVDSDSKIYDFNREKDGTYHKKYTQNLPLTNYTYDIFQVSGQGISGSYRLHRGDVGTVSDPTATDASNDVSAKVDLEIGGPPITVAVGVGGGYTNMDSKSGKWVSDDNFITKFKSETDPTTPGSEKVYFKKMGESTVENDPYFYNDIQKSTNVLKYGLISNSFSFPSNNFVSKPNQFKHTGEQTLESNSTVSNAVRSTRPNKATSFIYLTSAEAVKGNVLPIQEHVINGFGWKESIDGSTTNTYTSYKNTITPRVSDDRKGHHISEVRVTDESGTRYVYGIPAYNTKQMEITFAASVGQGKMNDAELAKKTGLIKYSSDDLGNNNKNGLDHYYNCVTTPANAHSYLLTCILSSDYVDSDNIPGPSDGDLGTYTKFNYAKLNSAYKWRTPMSENGNVASYSEGMTTEDGNTDDKGNIVYGEKEVWYLHSIETPTHVAEFHLSPRLDGLGTTGRDGAIGGAPLQKLDKIVLYNKADKSTNDPEPIKTVYFSYSYKLCPGTINSNAPVDAATDALGKGKLTLDKVWFTYGRSKKGVLNPYVFAYAGAGTSVNGKMDPALNPAYSHLNYDRWGNYKLNDFTAPNSSFPYTQQNDKNIVDRNAAVYALSTIHTPTGGSMHIVYESDDYAYVQNKKAMRMFKVASTQLVPNNDVLFDSQQRDEIVIDLGEGFIPSSTDQTTIDKEFRDKYLGDLDLMYFKVYANVVKSPFLRNEYVPGYAEIIKSGCKATISPDGKCRLATIKLKRLNAGLNRDINPIARAGWMYAKLNLSRELKGLKNAESMGAEDIMFALLAQVSSLLFSMTGFTTEMITKGNSSRIDPSKSFVKLLEPDQIKLGGGHRVKAIVMSDNWALMKSVKENTNNNAAKQTSYYGQKYDYTTTENGVTISSGVAAYEPIMGGDENPFRKPIFIEEKVPLAVNNIDFLEEPMGECFFPSPTVGYSKVVTTPLKITQSDFEHKNFRSNGTGIVEQEFYTAKDFPTYTERTGISTASQSPSLLSKFMKIASTDLVTCTQGYYIELNDMHGKSKSKRVYPQQDASTGKKPSAISEVEYRYKTSGAFLDNSIRTINPDLSIPAEKSNLGVEVDVVNDQREFHSTTLGGGIDLNIKTLIIVLVPVPVPTGFPDITDEFVRFRSLVTTKVVNRFAILEETIATDNGTSISTKNLAWDAKTGAVILTSIQNEFHDPIYTFTYPAHWAYPRMDQASTTDGMVFTNGYFDPNGNPSNMVNASKFNDGDELLLNYTTKAYLNYDKATSKWSMLDKDGNAAPAFAIAKVVRSGSRNMAAAPIGTVVMLSNPVIDNHIVFDKVINAGASEYKEEWKRMGCDCKDGSVSASTNPYQTGLKGNLRPYKSWTYLTDRYQRLVNNQMNIRTDGYYKDFAAFWDVRSGSALLTPPTNFVTSKWQYVTEITNYNPLGMEIENRDALNRYMMAQYGYNKKLPVATSNNSKYRESGFDSFEDYDNSTCVDDHFSWRRVPSIVLSDKEAHTGRKSIKVGPSQEIDLKKVITPCE